MADVIKDFIVEHAPFAAAAPTTTGWSQLKTSIRSIPNLFPTPDAVDYSVVTSHRPAFYSPPAPLSRSSSVLLAFFYTRIHNMVAEFHNFIPKNRNGGNA